MSPGLADLRAIGLDVSRETSERLEHYLDQLIRWSVSINLIAPIERGEAWYRHIIDSAQVFLLLDPQVRLWGDLGSGGGLPGIVNAIIARELAPEVEFALVESDRRKASFLRIIARDLGLRLRCESARIEDLAPLGADLISARALAPLDKLMGHLVRHLAPEGYALLMKGRQYENEIAAAQQIWRFDLALFESRVEPDSRILRVSNIRRA